MKYLTEGVGVPSAPSAFAPSKSINRLKMSGPVIASNNPGPASWRDMQISPGHVEFIVIDLTSAHHCATPFPRVAYGRWGPLD